MNEEDRQLVASLIEGCTIKPRIIIMPPGWRVPQVLAFDWLQWDCIAPFYEPDWIIA